MPDGEDALRWVSENSPHSGVSRGSYAAEFSYGRRLDLGSARVSIAEQDLERQIDALTAVGIARERIYLDTKSGAAVDRTGLGAVLWPRTAGPWAARACLTQPRWSTQSTCATPGTRWPRSWPKPG